MAKQRQGLADVADNLAQSDASFDIVFQGLIGRRAAGAHCYCVCNYCRCQATVEVEFDEELHQCRCVVCDVCVMSMVEGQQQ
jgi:hypothetical protein